jgi:hypothetical protein
VNVVILQFDLGSHTKAAMEMATDVQAFKEFKEFGEAVERDLSPLGFDCLHWLGDGGLFARRFDNNSDAESVCLAADAAFRIFGRKWNSSETRLTLRITATLLYGVFLSKDPGYWYSLRLNQFLKYERDIGRAGAFVITNDLLRHMDVASASFARFKDSKPRQVLINEGAGFAALADRDHSERAEPEAGRFEVWLTKRAWPGGAHSQDENWNGTVVGDSLVLGSALGIRGYESVELIPVESRGGSSVYSGEFRDRVEGMYDKLKHLSGEKACVKRCIPPLSDDPTLRIQWEIIDYSQARAFHEVTETDLEVWNHLSPHAGDADPRPFPGILVTHNVFLSVPKPGTRYLLLAHRKKGTRPGGYYNNRWSVSFEEQFSPVESVRDGRRFPADIDLRATVLRGAKEEFLGENFKGNCSVAIHAVQVETLSLNIGVLGAVTLPGVDLADLERMWRSPDTIDRDEHDALVALPLTSEVLEACLKGDGLPQEYWTAHRIAGRRDLGSDDQLWHPTSKARLALALWLLQGGTI